MAEEAASTQTTQSEATTVSADGTAQGETTYANGKFKSVSDLEKSYNEIQSAFSKKTAEYKESLGAFQGAPEGDYEFADGIEQNERLDRISEWARDNNFSNEKLNELILLDRSYQEEAQAKAIAQAKEELGKDADARIRNVVDWARANLGEDSIGALDKMITSADGVKMFEQIAKMNIGTAPAPSQQKQSVDADTLKQMRFAKDEYGNRKMSSDPAYRAKVEALEAEMIGNR